MKKKKWKSYYNKAMQKEDEIFLKEAKKKVEIAKEPLIVRRRKKNTKRGRKPYNWRAMVIICLLKIFHRKTYRETESYLRAHKNILEFLGIKKAPSKSTIQEFFKGIDKKFLIELNDSIIAEFQKKLNI